MKRTNCKTPHVNIFIYVLVIETSVLLTLVRFSYNSDKKINVYLIEVIVPSNSLKFSTLWRPEVVYP